MATLRQKQNGNYYIDYRVNGRRKRKHVGRSKKLASLALKDLEVKLARRELGFEQKDATFLRLLHEFKDYCKTNLSSSTQRRYQAILDNFQRFLRSKYPHLNRLSHFNPKVFEDYKAFRKEEDAHNRTINAELVVLRMMFRLGIQWGYTKENPTDGISKLRIIKKSAPRFLTEEECQKLLDACDDFLYPILSAFLNTGMRKSELEYLEWPDIDFNRRKIMIRAKGSWTPKTDEREIPMNDAMLKILKEQKARVNGSKYVFPDEKGKRIYKNRLRNRLMTLTKRCGFPDVTKIHSLRHTFASHLVMKGVDLATIKQLMGHSDIETTMIYSHLTEKHVDDAVERLEF